MPRIPPSGNDKIRIESYRARAVDEDPFYVFGTERVITHTVLVLGDYLCQPRLQGGQLAVIKEPQASW